MVRGSGMVGGRVILAIGGLISPMDMVGILMLMEMPIKEISKILISMVEELNNFLMVISILDPISMESLKDMDNILGLQVLNIKVTLDKE